MILQKKEKKRIMKFIGKYRQQEVKRKTEIKKSITNACGFSATTFHYKMKNLNYSKPEIDIIESIINEK